MKKMYFPIIRKYWKLFLATMLITAIGCAFTGGLAGSYAILEDALISFVRNYNYPDALITTEVTDRSRLSAIREVPGVRAVNARLCGDTVLQSADGRYLSIRAFSVNDDDIERFRVFESAEGNGLYEMDVEHDFAEGNGIHAGDVLLVKAADEWKEIFVRAIVSCPETITVQPTNDSWDLNADFGYVYASVHVLEAEYDQKYREAKEELDEKSEELDAAKEDANSELDDARHQLDEAEETLKEKEKLLADSEMEAEKKRAELIRTRGELIAKSTELTNKRAQLVSGQAQAEAGLSELTGKKALLAEASNGLVTIDTQLETVASREEALMGRDVQTAVNALRQVPADTEINEVLSAVSRIQTAISSAEAYGFYYDVNDSLRDVVAGLNTFMAGVRSDAAYLVSPDAVSVILRIENGETGIGETPEYANVAAVVSRYVRFNGPEELPAAYAQALSAIGNLTSVITDAQLDLAVAQLSGFDMTQTVREVSARVENATAAAVQLESTMGVTFKTTGELLAAYDSAVSELASARTALESSRAEVVNALAAQGLTESDIPGTLALIDTNIAALESTLNDIRTGIPEIDEGLRQIEDGLLEIGNGIEEIDKQLADAREQIEEAREELENNETAYQENVSDALLEFASLDEELAKAYEALADGQGYGDLCNQFLLWFDEDVDPENVLCEVRAAIPDVLVKSDYTYARSPVKKRIDDNLEPLYAMSVFIPGIYFATLLFIVFLFMSLIVRQCRREIGILRALGFSVGSIRGLFSAINLGIMVCAAVLGFGLGVILAWFAGGKYADFFSLMEYSMKIDWVRTLQASALAVLVGQVSTVMSTAVVARISPAEAMSRPAPATGTGGPAGRLTRRLRPMTAFSITTMFRNPVRFIFSAISIAATVMLIYSGLAFLSAKERILTDTFGDRIRYDAQVFFSKPLTEETLSEIRALDYVSDVQELPYYQMDISFDGKTEAALLNAVEPGTELLGVYTRDGEALSLDLPGDGILMEEHVAKALGVSVGDEVLVDGRVPLRVTDIGFQCVSQNQYISMEGAEALGDETIGGLILRISPENEQKLLAVLSERDDYLYAVFTRLSYEGMKKLLRSFDFAAWLIVLFAVGVGVIVVLNTSRTNILEKKKELCVLRTLGFQRSEISRSWFSQCILQFILAMALGFPAGRMVAEVGLREMSGPTREYVYANSPRELLITGAIVFAYILLSHFAAMHDMKGWDIVESVKEKE